MPPKPKKPKRSLIAKEYLAGMASWVREHTARIAEQEAAIRHAKEAQKQTAVIIRCNREQIALERKIIRRAKADIARFKKA